MKSSFTSKRVDSGVDFCSTHTQKIYRIQVCFVIYVVEFQNYTWLTTTQKQQFLSSRGDGADRHVCRKVAPKTLLDMFPFKHTVVQYLLSTCRQPLLEQNLLLQVFEHTTHLLTTKLSV
jgi:hypothetical protein